MKRIVIAALLAASTAAHAESFFQIEAGLGVTRYTKEDGRWFQQGTPGADNKVSSKPPAFSLGLTGPIVTRERWGVDWHAEYVNLGRAAASCNCTPNDENYDAKTHKFTDVMPADPAGFSGSGVSQGFVLSVEPYYVVHSVRLGLEVGAYIHRDTWHEYVTGWQTTPDMPKQSFDISQKSWSVAPVVGVSVSKDRYTLSYRHYFMRVNASGRNVPPLWNDADVLEVKMRF